MPCPIFPSTSSAPNNLMRPNEIIMNKPLISILAIFAIVLIVVSQAMFIVDEREQAVVLQFGQPVGGDTGDADSFIKKPGLHFKIPLIQDVQRLAYRFARSMLILMMR